jgi:hypothetical protein
MKSYIAVTAAGIVTGGLLLAGCSSSSGSSAGSGGGASTGGSASNSYTGTSWQVSALAQGGKAVTIPAGLVATMEFPSTTKLVLDDSATTFSGIYLVNGSGFTVSNLATTTTSTGAPDPSHAAVIAAVDSLGSGGSSPTSVATKFSGSQLIVTVGQYQLTFDKAAPAARATAARSAGSSTAS